MEEGLDIKRICPGGVVEEGRPHGHGARARARAQVAGRWTALSPELHFSKRDDRSAHSSVGFHYFSASLLKETMANLWLCRKGMEKRPNL